MPKMFYDFEFTRLHQRTTPVSVGFVSEDGQRQFYAEFTDYDRAQVDEWLQANVLSLLTLGDKPEGYMQQEGGLTQMRGKKAFIMGASGGLCDWLTGSAPLLTMSSFGANYDWVLFRELFRKTNTDWPSNLSYWSYDVATLVQECGYTFTGLNAGQLKGRVLELFGQDNTMQLHNALVDAQVVRQLYFYLKQDWVMQPAPTARGPKLW